MILADFHETPGAGPQFTNRRDITPKGARWLETGNFAPDGKSLLITADIGLTDQQGMDQFVLDIVTGDIRNLTNSPKVWDEHGGFSADGEKIFFMSSYPYRTIWFFNSALFLRTEFMPMNKDGSGLEQLTHFSTPGFPESNPLVRGSVSANGEWHPNGGGLSVLNLCFPTYQTWNFSFTGACGASTPTLAPDRASQLEGQY